jgi:hypothetical protein
VKEQQSGFCTSSDKFFFQKNSSLIAFSQMCNFMFIAFADDVPIEFKTQFTRFYKWYLLASSLCTYSTTIGSVSAMLIASFQQLFQSSEMSATLSLSIPILLCLTTFVAAIAKLCKKTQQKQLDRIFRKYPHHFKIIPDVDGDTLSPFAVHTQALKFYYYK